MCAFLVHGDLTPEKHVLRGGSPALWRQTPAMYHL
jgi:hypothetical protein